MNFTCEMTSQGEFHMYVSDFTCEISSHGEISHVTE